MVENNFLAKPDDVQKEKIYTGWAKRCETSLNSGYCSELESTVVIWGPPELVV
jgi:hypothetical protein